MIQRDYLVSFLEKHGLKCSLPSEKGIAAIHKLSYAHVQLDRAIRLFLDEEDFACAITLASAADNILREMLKAEFDIDGMKASAILVDRLYRRRNMNPPGAWRLIRGELQPANWLKHYGSDPSTGEPSRLDFDMEDAANMAIDRAIGNMDTALESLFSEQLEKELIFDFTQTSRFLEYIGR